VKVTSAHHAGPSIFFFSFYPFTVQRPRTNFRGYGLFFAPLSTRQTPYPLIFYFNSHPFLVPFSSARPPLTASPGFFYREPYGNFLRSSRSAAVFDFSFPPLSPHLRSPSHLLNLPFPLVHVYKSPVSIDSLNVPYFARFGSPPLSPRPLPLTPSFGISEGRLLSPISVKDD